MSADILTYALGIALTVLWWLLRNKATEQTEQIRILFEKHEHDAEALQSLRVQIAAKHYERPELDAKFDRLDATFRCGFDQLGAKFDRLSDALTSHISKESK